MTCQAPRVRAVLRPAGRPAGQPGRLVGGSQAKRCGCSSRRARALQRRVPLYLGFGCSDCVLHGCEAAPPSPASSRGSTLPKPARATRRVDPLFCRWPSASPPGLSRRSKKNSCSGTIGCTTRTKSKHQAPRRPTTEGGEICITTTGRV